jgi:hypothetical protein
VKVTSLVTREVESVPREMEDGVLYVSRRFELAIHLCACGCGGETVTPLDHGTAGWRLTDDAQGPTLRPSIGNQSWPCGSHYRITNGRIEPC